MATVIDYDADRERFENFFSQFYTYSGKGPGRADGKIYNYARQLTAIANRDKVMLTVELDDVEEFFSKQLDYPEIIQNIENNAKRYTQIMCEAVSKLLPSFKTRDSVERDSLDHYIKQRLARATEVVGGGDLAEEEVEKLFPPELLRRFELYLKPRSGMKVMSMRSLKAHEIGKLVTVKGTVIRASEVRPLLSVATYTCDSCSCETFQPIASPTFSPLLSCPSDACKANKTGGRLQLQTRGSKFKKFQEVRIQEESGDVPEGCVPRSLSVHCYGENTRIVGAGEHVRITGVWVPLAKDTAFAQISHGLLASTYLEAHQLTCLSKWDDGELDEELTEEEAVQFTEPDFYSKLAASIAPEVYGHEDVKKSLLLMLVGGVERHVGGLKIRGTINICLMGDPGVAKSQLLAYIDRLAPRSQMTTGRGSSGVGLTASIMKDPVTGLMTLEAGALMLADQGVCCIDEFDKMNESDRTALHEVMEQQTISVAKAGILTTLHARTSVLAAANPAYGRYNPNRSIQENINLPAALLSRFDILWLLRDKADQQEDTRLAEHITYVHQHNHEPAREFVPLEMSVIRKYISACKKKNPLIPMALSERLVAAYVELRNEARNAKETTFTSPRSLLAILRLSTALARLRMGDEVIEDDVTEAIRLVERSRDSVKPAQVVLTRTASANERISSLINKMDRKQGFILMDDIRDKVARAGFTSDQLERCLDSYEANNVWHINHKRTKLIFV